VCLVLVIAAVAVSRLVLPPAPAPVADADRGGDGAVPASISASVPPSVEASPEAAAVPSAGPGAARTSAPPAGTSAKKGVSTWNFSQNAAAMKAVSVAWYYNWSASPAQGVGSTEFVPMIWGPGSVTASNLNRAKTSGKTLLAFNEPDFASQANMSVEQALMLWPQLQATGLRLGSPAVATGGATAGGWLDRFMTGARQRGYRVDFIALHWYGSDFSSAAVTHLANYLRAVHERYGLPIWLTEYALIKFGSGGSTYPSAAQQTAFIKGSTEMMNQLSYVERYAWFALPTPDEGGEGTGLFHAGQGLTAAGNAYRSVGG